jgi:MinD-like ATPase involved in chromosome partitioning or flagellar assembly
MSSRPAGFFIGVLRPQDAEGGPSPHEPAGDRPAPREPVVDQSAPGTGVPEDVDAGAPELEAAEDEAAGAEVGDSEAATSEAPDIELAFPSAAEPGVDEPERAEAGVAEGGVAEAERAEAGVAEPEAPEETAESEAADSESAEPGMAESESASGEPEHAEPENAEPEVALPAAQTTAPEAPPEDELDEDWLEQGDPAHQDDAPGQDPPAGAAEPGAGSPSSPATPWSPPIVVVRSGSATRPTLVERALSGPGQHRGATSWREHVRVVPGGHGPGRPDMERRDRARVLLPIHGPRLIVVLGCTVGAGQTVTTLMLGDVLASLRAEPVAALDLNPGQTSLADMARTSPVGTARGLLAGASPTVPGQRGRGRLDLIAHDSAPDDAQALADEEYARVIEILASRYPLTLTDPGASAVARVLSAADQLVLVAPASSDAARAVAMTMEWLDGHGYGELCTGAITVINGVSKRSMSHVEQAELVVRGRCRAIVRVPWDDHLGAPPTEQGISAAATADAESRFAQLRPQVQHAYTALAGVLVSALAVGGSRGAPPGPVPPEGAPQRWAAR